MEMNVQCAVCGSSEWKIIPNPVEGRSVTAAGVIFDQAISRGQCSGCGLVQRINVPFVGQSDFYEKKYASYYERPGAAVFDAPRYDVMAHWMKDAIGDLNPRRILDVGCGAGWSMKATRKIFVEAEIEGIDPSEANTNSAREAGFHVYTMKAGHGEAFDGKYDLIYSNNVINHVVDLEYFLQDLKEHLSPGGKIVLICADASTPSNELLWCDVNYSFRPQHLKRIAEKAGLKVVYWDENPPNVTVLNKQIAVLAESGVDAVVGRPGISDIPLDRLFDMRCQYMREWQGLHRALVERTAGCERIYNFGSSMWTWLLAAYCPDYWTRVEAAVVDGFSGRCIDKAVVPFESIPFGPGDALVLGLNPKSQPDMKIRLADCGAKVVTWDDLVRV